jgi:transcriptional regulator NrdR family protein
MKYLKKLGRVAYLGFASIYKQFEEPEDFQKLLREVRA